MEASCNGAAKIMPGARPPPTPGFCLERTGASLRGAKRRSNPGPRAALDCVADARNDEGLARFGGNLGGGNQRDIAVEDRLGDAEKARHGVRAVMAIHRRLVGEA